MCLGDISYYVSKIVFEVCDSNNVDSKSATKRISENIKYNYIFIESLLFNFLFSTSALTSLHI